MKKLIMAAIAATALAVSGCTSSQIPAGEPDPTPPASGYDIVEITHQQTLHTVGFDDRELTTTDTAQITELTDLLAKHDWDPSWTQPHTRDCSQEGIKTLLTLAMADGESATIDIDECDSDGDFESAVQKLVTEWRQHTVTSVDYSQSAPDLETYWRTTEDPNRLQEMDNLLARRNFVSDKKCDSSSPTVNVTVRYDDGYEFAFEDYVCEERGFAFEVNKLVTRWAQSDG